MLGKLLILIAVVLGLFLVGKFSATTPPRAVDNAVQKEIATIRRFYTDAPAEVNNTVKKALPSMINPDMDPWSTNIATIGRSYRVYSVDLADAKTLDPKAKGTGASIISADYSWEYFLLDAKGKAIGLAVAEKYPEDITWEASADNLYDFSKMNELAADPDRLIKYLRKQGIFNINAIKRFRVYVMGMDFIYIESAKGQYIMPLDLAGAEARRKMAAYYAGGHPEMVAFVRPVNLEAGKVYEAAVALAKIIDWKVNLPNVANNGGLLINQ